MGLLVEVTVTVRSPDDNSVQVATHRQTVTVNPQIGDPDAEASLAKAAVDSLASESVREITENLDDWSAAIKVIREGHRG